MLKKILTIVFVVVFTLFTLNYFKILPSDKILGFNNISYRQIQTINESSVLEKSHTSNKFTNRMANKDYK